MRREGSGIARFVFLAIFLLLTGISTKTAEAYPAPKIIHAGVESFKSADTSTAGTFMDAMITGPSPVDIQSFTVTGPSGAVYDILLHPYFSTKWGIDYWHGESGVLPNGDYTFHIVDKAGREASVTKSFTYNSNIPTIDPATMRPANNSYVGTATPTLSFSAPQGNFYYRVYIRDYLKNNTLYVSHPSRSTSVTVPTGILQANTPYTWFVRVQESSSNFQNKYQSAVKFFFTGTRSTFQLKQHENIYIESFTQPGYSGYDFGAWNIPIAPWDINSFTVTGPDSNVYPVNRLSPRVDSPILYYGTVNSSSFTMPDGTYSFSLTDSSNNAVTATANFAYTSTPAVSESSRLPADDAYFDTSTPTFSWDPVSGRSNLKYRLRIFGYNGRIIVYSSPFSSATSVTLTASLHLPNGLIQVASIYD